jgi:acetoin utilization deacetylase AcuC-like enzyme/nucleotide-binding universal stress UspA family protein
MLPCPILVVRPDIEGAVDVDCMAACCNRSGSGGRLAHYGATLAKLFGARLHLLHAMMSAADPELMDPSDAPYAEAQQELQSRTKQYLLSKVPKHLQSTVEVAIHLSAGPATDQLPSMVDGIPCQLLLVGVRRRRALGQWMTGSTTEAILRKAHCHLLVVPDHLDAISYCGLSSATHRKSGAIAARTGVYRDPLFLAHRTPEGHPENHHRLETIYAMLEAYSEDPLMAPSSASVEELTLVHSPAYIRQIEQTARLEASQVSADTFASADTYAAACLAAGGVIAAVDAVLKGNLRNALVLERPPGHHAEIGRASGFCLFNNVAIGARYARRIKGLRKVLIIDWDLHHGNGTQHIFEEDASVMYISTHQYPCFPGTGHYLETGRGPGQGYTINLPLGKKWGDGDYVALYQRLVTPVALAFNPDLILVSAGFDIHKKDPLGKMRVSEDGFAALTRIMMDLASKSCHDRLVLVLEGGYNPKALASSILAVLSELGGRTHAKLDQLAARARSSRVDPVISRCAHVVGHFWSEIGSSLPAPAGAAPVPKSNLAKGGV